MSRPLRWSRGTSASRDFTDKSIAARRLFELEQVEVTYEEQSKALWTFMRPRGRPCYNPELLDEWHAWQRGIRAAFEERPDDLHYLLVGSRSPGVWNLGGDLGHFTAKIRERDRQALVAYGESCVRILHNNLNTLGLPMVTIGVAQGDALGGGFESLLSFNVIIAERGTKFGFPETMFGLFPGMGAHALVTRRIGAAFAEEMMLSGRTYSAEEMLDLGLIHIVTEPGQAIAEARNYIARNKRRHHGNRAIFAASREVNPLTLSRTRPHRADLGRHLPAVERTRSQDHAAAGVCAGSPAAGLAGRRVARCARLKAKRNPPSEVRERVCRFKSGLSRWVWMFPRSSVRPRGPSPC